MWAQIVFAAPATPLYAAFVMAISSSVISLPSPVIIAPSEELLPVLQSVAEPPIQLRVESSGKSIQDPVAPLICTPAKSKLVPWPEPWLIAVPTLVKVTSSMVKFFFQN